MHPIQYLVDNMMLPILQFFYNFSGNFGVAIVLLTLTVKALLFPLTIKQTRSMAGMKEIQPKIKELQKKHKDNPQMMQMKMMELYKQHGVNPLGGCLPVLLQLPFFIAIFVTLNSEAFRTLVSQPGVSASFLWIKDLSLPDKTMILPILVALSTYLSQQTMSTGSKDDPQMKMLAYMPLLMLFISFNLPSGVLIYWAISQFLTALQQYMMTSPNKKSAVTTEAAAVMKSDKQPVIETTAEPAELKSSPKKQQSKPKSKSSTKKPASNRKPSNGKKTTNRKKPTRKGDKKGA